MEERWEPNAREVVEGESKCEIESVVHVDYKDSLAASGENEFQFH